VKISKLKKLITVRGVTKPQVYYLQQVMAYNTLYQK
jgi:hypothetical protein